MGRPRIEGRAQECMVTFRMTPELKHEAARKADSAGIGLSEWLRAVVQDAVGGPTRVDLHADRPTSIQTHVADAYEEALLRL